MADQWLMRTMRAAAWSMLFLLGGCLEMEQTVVLKPDGSGRQTVRLVMKESTLKEIERASVATQGGAAGNPSAVFDEKLVAGELTAAGMTMTSHQVTKSPGRRTVAMEATFPDFATLQKSPLCGSAAEWVLAAGPRPGTAKLTLYPQGKAAWEEARARAEKMKDGVDPVVEGFFQKQKENLVGLDITLRFQLPGDVLLSTVNLEKTGDREVTAHVTADQIKTASDLVRRLSQRFEVIFDAAGCKLPLQ